MTRALDTAAFIFPKGYLFGLTLSTAGSSATFGVAAGEAVDTTGLAYMRLLSAYTKTTSAWAVGTAAGALDTGTIANNTWYHVYLIERLDTGVVDVLLSLSVSAPTMPANYTVFRRLGSMLTNGSAQWALFLQTGDLFIWSAPVGDVNAANPGTSAVLRTLSVPPGVKVSVRMVVYVSNEASLANGGTYISDPDLPDTTPLGAVNLYGILNLNTTNSAFFAECITSASRQIRTRAISSSGNTNIAIGTVGWTDTRGKLF